jgi:hypothetical protein
MPDCVRASRRRSSGREILDRFGGQRLGANAPFAARDLRNLDLSPAAHVLAVDRHYGVGQLSNRPMLSLGIEHVLEELNFYQCHCHSP